jgi:hypothetical protein
MFLPVFGLLYQFSKSPFTLLKVDLGIVTIFSMLSVSVCPKGIKKQ